MPCGGIGKYTDVPPGKCFQCGEDGATHYCHEWDCMLHADCVVPFLSSEEGELVIAHGHTVTIWFEDSRHADKATTP